MSRLFLRVFLWFWLGSTCLVIVLAASLVMAQPDVVTAWRFIGRTAMRSLGAQIANAYERAGARDAAELLENASRDGRVRLWLYDVRGNLVAGAAPVANADEVIAQALSGQDDESGGRDRSALQARLTSSDSGRQYVVAWESPRALRWSAGLSPIRLSLRLAALLLTSGVVCWLLTWHITRPIQTLRAAARRAAGGDLSVRVSGDKALQRGDELSELAREFDQMALRLENHIASQQQFLADISHELRSPLARLSLALDLARRRLGEDVPEHQRIELEVQRLNELIGQLITLARLQQASPPATESVDLRELLHEVARDARFEAEAADRTVIIERECAALVKGNRGLLRSALENVVRNAVRHAPPRTTVSIAMDATAPGRLEIVVRDRGTGVPPQALARLFDPFFRVDEARDRTSGGVGLGLAITRQAVLAHGGDVHAENHPDGGLLVRLALPVV